jgi:hypothetical protein
MVVLLAAAAWRLTCISRWKPARVRTQVSTRQLGEPRISPEAGCWSGRHPREPARTRNRAPGAGLRPDGSARVPVRSAPAADDTRASDPAPAKRLPATTSRYVGRAFSSSTVCGRRACRSSRGPCGDAGNNPCRRQGDQVVAPTSSGRWLVVEDDHGGSRGRRYRGSPDRVAGGVGGRRPLAGRACRDGRPGGGGVRRPRSGRSRDVRPWPPVCARFRPRLRSSAHARTARSRVVRCGRWPRPGGDEPNRGNSERAGAPVLMGAVALAALPFAGMRTSRRAVTPRCAERPAAAW